MAKFSYRMQNILDIKYKMESQAKALYASSRARLNEEQARLEREDRIQQATLHIKKKFGKNALVKGMDLQEDATTIARNGQIGGHKA